MKNEAIPQIVGVTTASIDVNAVSYSANECASVPSESVRQFCDIAPQHEAILRFSKDTLQLGANDSDRLDGTGRSLETGSMTVAELRKTFEEANRRRKDVVKDGQGNGSAVDVGGESGQSGEPGTGIGCQEEIEAHEENRSDKLIGGATNGGDIFYFGSHPFLRSFTVKRLASMSVRASQKPQVSRIQLSRVQHQAR